MMADLPKEPIFFRDEHRAFLETRDADVLDYDLMHLNLHRQATGTMFSRRARWRPIIYKGLLSLFFFGAVLPAFVYLGVATIHYIANEGFQSPRWDLAIYRSVQVLCVILSFAFFALGGVIFAKDTVVLYWWNNQRIHALLEQLVHEGVLLRGDIYSTEYNNLLMSKIVYRFKTESGEEFERVFYPDNYVRREVGTPVWVLYLNDDISVLL